jgi:two-component system response regulator FixJ
MDGFEVQAELTKRGISLPVIMLTGHGDVALAIRAMKRGAADFLEKPFDGEELVEAIERAMALAEQGQRVESIKAMAEAKLRSLTPRETQMLQGLQAGMANKVIARWIELSPRTVEVYRANMMAKIGAENLSQALRIAMDGGLQPIDIAASKSDYEES